MADMLLYTVQEINLIKVIRLSKISCHASFQSPKCSGTSVATMSQVCMSTMMSLLIIENRKVYAVASNGIMFIPNLLQTGQVVQ
jgi:hypothetical protein